MKFYSVYVSAQKRGKRYIIIGLPQVDVCDIHIEDYREFEYVGDDDDVDDDHDVCRYDHRSLT